MVKITGPCHSDSASGQFGKALIFSKRRSGQMVRAFHKPARPRTGDQLAQREIIAGLTAYWHTFTTAQKAVYNLAAQQSGEKITGFNLWIREANADLFTKYGLVAFFPFEDKTSTVFADKSGRGKNAINYGGVLQQGVIGQGVSYVPTNYSESQGNTIAGAAVCTLAAWVKITARSNYHFGILLVGTSEVRKAFYIGGMPNNHFGCGLYGINNLDSVFLPLLGQWYHLVMTYNTDLKMRVYVNGVLKNTSVAVTATLTGNVIRVGRLAINYPMNGVVDDARVYNRVLALSEIKALYNLGFSKLKN